MAVRQHQALLTHGLLEVLQLCLHADRQPSCILICATQDNFINTFQRLAEELSSVGDAEQAGSYQSLQNSLDSLPTLRSIASYRSLRLAFCHDLPRLRAYLAQLTASTTGTGTYARLVVMNMLHVHVPTSSWSAQGVNRSLAAAVDAATAMSCTLLLCEDAALSTTGESHDMLLSSSPPYHQRDSASDSAPHDIWDEEIGLIESHTRTFGHENHGWAGRKITVKLVVQRWLTIVQDVALQDDACG